jgi:hypothetical protein
MKNTSGFRTFLAAADLTRGARVRVDSNGSVVLAGVTNGQCIGSVEGDITSGQYISVRLANATGTAEYIASGAIAVGAVVFPAANGKVGSASASANTAVGIALEASSADGDIIEVMPLLPAA